MPAKNEWPEGPVDVILDTDAFAEIDDQFAIAYLLRSPEKLRCRAICAAPFQDLSNGVDPGRGMELSFDEIRKVLSLMGCEDLYSNVFKGSRQWLPDESTPVPSPAAAEIVRLAREYTPENPLYVVGIGAITNVASALLTPPEIKENIVVVWLGGHARHWPQQNEFNLVNDIAAARVVFQSGAALVQLPCMGVVSAFTTTKPELQF